MAARGSSDTPVLRTIAPKGEGVTELADAIEEHRARLAGSGRLEEHRLERARRQVLALARHALLQRVLEANEANGRLDSLVRAVAVREIDPYAAAQQLISASRE
jgi:LAO/AO transport system kinase